MYRILWVAFVMYVYFERGVRSSFIDWAALVIMIELMLLRWDMKDNNAKEEN